MTWLPISRVAERRVDCTRRDCFHSIFPKSAAHVLQRKAIDSCSKTLLIFPCRGFLRYLAFVAFERGIFVVVVLLRCRHDNEITPPPSPSPSPRPSSPPSPSPDGLLCHPSPSKLTSETFKEMCGESDPKQIFLAATVGATSTAVGFPPGNGGAGSAEVKDALRELGVPVVTCFSSRLHAVAMRSLGCASACSPDDFCRSSGDTLGSTGGEDDKQSSSNPKMREILDKATAMIRAFEDWPRRDGGDSELEPLLAELEDLVVMSERAQLACARLVERGTGVEEGTLRRRVKQDGVDEWVLLNGEEKTVELFLRGRLSRPVSPSSAHLFFVKCRET